MKYTELVVIRMRPGTKAALQAKADEEDVSLSHVVRKAIKKWLDSVDKTLSN